MLGDEVGELCRALLRGTTGRYESVVQTGSINRGQVHSLLPMPPALSVSRAVQHRNGRTSQELGRVFTSIRQRAWVVSSGNVTDQARTEQIDRRVPPETDDD